jgi:zinc and cadmium transporter
LIELIYIIISGLGIAIISLAIVVALSWKDRILNEILLLLVALSAGTMIGGAFLHLLPEAIEETESALIFPIILIGFMVFYVLEKTLHFHHTHKHGEHVHTFHYMSIIGAAIHSFVDGLLIAASFVISTPLGITTAIMVASHEIPKKVGDFGVLVYGGFHKERALITNFLVSLGVVIGGIVGYIISTSIEIATEFLLPLAAGGFIYVGAADLIPEIRKETDIRKSIIMLEVIILGILFMWILKGYFHH